MDPVIWAVLLMTLGLALVLLEIFIPSGGILGFLAATAIFGSIFMAFSGVGPTAGFTFLAFALAGVPVVVVLAFKWLPNTPVGRRLLLNVPTSDEVLPEEDQRKQLRQMIGKVGKAKASMLPGGAIVVDGKLYDAVSEAGAVDAGDPVEIVQVRNNRLVVRKTAEKPQPQKSDDILSQPIDAVVQDPFDDPLS